MFKQNHQPFWLLFLLCVSCTNPSFAQFPPSLNGQPLFSLAPMLEKAMPAVVNISSAQTQISSNPLLNDPFFRHFFNMPAQKTHSRGSGVVIDANKGYVVTNHHVIENANEITVNLQDGREFKAEVIGTDPETDVALMRIPANNLTTLPSANSDQLRVGDFVVAIGNPFGLGQTVTSGIVSALGRSGLGIEGYEDFIQTDASINPGNSGGALVNLRGELIGINTAIFAPSGGNVGIGFAIPSNMVQQVVQHLVQFGEVQRGSLGIRIQELTPQLASALGLENSNKGAIVSEVAENSPAEKAGLQPADVIVAINDQPVNRGSDVRNRIGLLRVGDKVALTVLRKGRIFHLTAVLAEDGAIDGGKVSEYLEGAELKNVPDGVQVEQVKRNTNAYRLRLRRGDIISGIDDQRVRNWKVLKKLFAESSLPILIKLQRNGEEVTILLR